MDRIINKLYFVKEGLNIVQRRLDFEDFDYEIYPQFATQKSLGRTAILALGLGTLFGIHITILLLLTFFIDDTTTNSNSNSNVLVLLLFSSSSSQQQTLSMLWQWCFYVCTMCIFHLLEFFTTAIYNPLETSSNSFLVNQSKAYTAAALISATEFWLKFLFYCCCGWPSSSSMPNIWLIRIGVIGVCISQYIRTIAMKTCGESFNHMIQTSKKENHILITKGIYSYLRHPSYVGFYYWSISTQLVLTNYISILLFTIASWMFFKRRIPYEELSLVEHFPNDYPSYAKSTWVGIPFIPNHIDEYVEEIMKSNSNESNNNNDDDDDDDDDEGIEVTDTNNENHQHHHEKSKAE